jgi:hypothetical protein
MTAGVYWDEGGAVYNVKAYGAQGDGIIAYDGSTTLSESLFTSASLQPFGATPVISLCVNGAATISPAMNITGITFTSSMGVYTVTVTVPGTGKLYVGQRIVISSVVGMTGVNNSVDGSPSYWTISEVESATPSTTFQFQTTTAISGTYGGSGTLTGPTTLVTSLGAPFTTTLTVTGSPTGGTFTVNTPSGPSSNIAYNAT